MTPRETDEQLAELHYEVYRVSDRRAMNSRHALHVAGAQFYYRGRKRVTDMKVAEALEILKGHADYVAAYKAEHAYTEESTYNGESYTYEGTDWDAWDRPGLLPREADTPGEVLAKRAEYDAEITRLNREIDELEATYTGWSRFFLVTSSAGHIHSSTCCSTCRPTTRFGWLPNLSGQTEEQAVADLGPSLCTVCFPSAPTEYTAGKKLTKAQAERLAA